MLPVIILKKCFYKGMEHVKSREIYWNLSGNNLRRCLPFSKDTSSRHTRLINLFCHFSETSLQFLKDLCMSVSEEKSRYECAFRSSHWRCSIKKGVLKNFAKFTGEDLYLKLFLIKFQASGLQLY